MRMIEKRIDAIIMIYIPKHTTCRYEEQKRAYLREKQKESILAAIKLKADMSNPLSVNLTTEWRQRDPDMSVCSTCKEIIYSQGYQLHWILNGEDIEQITENKIIRLCEPCYLKKDV